MMSDGPRKTDKPICWIDFTSSCRVRQFFKYLTYCGIRRNGSGHPQVTQRAAFEQEFHFMANLILAFAETPIPASLLEFEYRPWVESVGAKSPPPRRGNNVKRFAVGGAGIDLFPRSWLGTDSRA